MTCCRQAAGTALSSNSSPARIGSRRSGWQDFTTAVPRPTRQLSTTATRVGGDVIPQERQRRSTQQARQDARVNSTSSSPSSSTSTSSPPPRLPYGVTRTLRNHALPVYSSIRNAGLRNEVLIRHCVGNLNVSGCGGVGVYISRCTRLLAGWLRSELTARDTLRIHPHRP